MPTAKSTKSKSKSKKSKNSKASKKAASTTAPAEETVDAGEVTLTEEELAPPAPAPEAADSSAEETSEATAESNDPYQRALDKLQSLMDFEKAIWQQAQKHHRTVIQGILDAMKLVRASRGRKRKTGSKKGTNSNSGINAQRNISKEMRSFLSSFQKKHKSFEPKDTYNYPSLCTAVMTYGNSEHEDLQGMKITNDVGEESVNASYIRLDPKLTKLFTDFDKHCAIAAEAGKKTLLKDGKNRWVNRAGVMKLISPHLLDIVPVATAASAEENDDDDANAEETASA